MKISGDVVLLSLVIFVFISIALFLKLLKKPKTIVIREVVKERPNIQERSLPYWTLYGTPTYWPQYLSPYWFYDVAYTGPIITGGGYYTPHSGHIGKAVGGGGGGGGGGHRGH